MKTVQIHQIIHLNTMLQGVYGNDSFLRKYYGYISCADKEWERSLIATHIKEKVDAFKEEMRGLLGEGGSDA